MILSEVINPQEALWFVVASAGIVIAFLGLMDWRTWFALLIAGPIVPDVQVELPLPV